MKIHKHTQLKPAAWKLSATEAARFKLLLKALKRMKTCQGMRLRRAEWRGLTRISEMIERQGHCLDGPRPARRRTYTEDMMEAAVRVLGEHNQSLLTTPTLVRLLQEQSILPRTVDLQTFTTHLKAHMRRMGHHLIMTSTGTIFCMLAKDKVARCSYCKSMLKWLEKHPLEALVFVDEVQLAAAVHPKGEPQAERARMALATTWPLVMLHVACHACLLKPLDLRD